MLYPFRAKNKINHFLATVSGFKRKQRINMRFRISGFFVFLVVCFLFLCESGCKRNQIPGTVPAEGVLLYEGGPLPWAVVSVVPKEASSSSRSATAMTDANGRFVLRTLGQNGVLPNEYFVSVKKYIKNEGADTVEQWKKNRKDGIQESIPESDVLDVVSAIPVKFDRPRQSGIEITIGPKGDRDLKIELTD